VVLELDGPDSRRLVVSGDLGRPNHPLLVPPAAPPAADAVLVESTYGNRRHDEACALDCLEQAVVRTARRGGVVLIPAFAVDRTEVVLLHLKRLTAEGRIPDLPVYADSPMALEALSVYREAVAAGDPEIRPELRGTAFPFDPGDLIEARDADASRAINEVDGPAIIISASGMATGGRVLHHLARRLPDARNAVVLVGFQAAQTRGRRLLEGERTLKMFGRYVPVRAEIVDCSGLSVHADREEILAWLGGAEAAPELAYVVHGEPSAAASLRDAIEAGLGWPCVLPGYRERVIVGVSDWRKRSHAGGDRG
jgi:metallo-beta-lactamase family protein